MIHLFALLRSESFQKRINWHLVNYEVDRLILRKALDRYFEIATPDWLRPKCPPMS